VLGVSRLTYSMGMYRQLPDIMRRLHPRYRTPYVVTIVTGLAVAIAAAFFPVGRLADISNAGTLYAFLMVAIAVLVLRRSDPSRRRSFRVPGVWIVAPLTIAGCVFLFLNLPTAAMLFLPAWGVIGIVIYFVYSRSHSQLGRGVVEVVDDIGGEETMLPIDPPQS
jgi:APA family basic amino acid/polyamine antiporter